MKVSAFGSGTGIGNATGSEIGTGIANEIEGERENVNGIGVLQGSLVQQALECRHVRDVFVSSGRFLVLQQVR